MKKPANGDQSDSEDYYPKYPSSCLSVETGERWQDRGILDAFLHAIPAVNVRRSARWQTFVIRLPTGSRIRRSEPCCHPAKSASAYGPCHSPPLWTSVDLAVAFAVIT